MSKLTDLEEIKGTYLTFDSSNIPAKVKENNLKTSIKDRFTKTKRPKGDPESRLSIMVHFPKPFQKEIKYFWGYRNFVLSDALSELPILRRNKREEYPYSPWFYPSFTKGNGCIFYAQEIPDDIRKRIDYGSAKFIRNIQT